MCSESSNMADIIMFPKIAARPRKVLLAPKLSNICQTLVQASPRHAIVGLSSMDRDHAIKLGQASPILANKSTTHVASIGHCGSNLAKVREALANTDRCRSSWARCWSNHGPSQSDIVELRATLAFWGSCWTIVGHGLDNFGACQGRPRCFCGACVRRLSAKLILPAIIGLSRAAATVGGSYCSHSLCQPRPPNFSVDFGTGHLQNL